MLRAELALPELKAAQRSFSRASTNVAGASLIHDRARAVLLERLDLLGIDPEIVVDVGCGTGGALRELHRSRPKASIVGVDRNHDMSVAAASGSGSRTDVIVGDAECLPLPATSVDMLLANLLLPWCLPQRFFAETARVLKPSGICLFATLGPETFTEVRRAWSDVDDLIHVHGLVDIHDVGDLAARAGLAEPVLDREIVTLTYPSIRALIDDIRACGAVNTAAGRRKTLTGKLRWQRFESALHANRSDRIGISIELIYGQVWGRDRVPAPARAAEVEVPVDRIGKRTKG